MNDFTLEGLPPGTEVKWNNLCAVGHNYGGEDAVWLMLANGIGIDCGDHSRYVQSDVLFKVCVVPHTDQGGWACTEVSYCRTPQEAATEIVRLANKYADPWYAGISGKFAEDDWKGYRRGVSSEQERCIDIVSKHLNLQESDIGRKIISEIREKED